MPDITMCTGKGCPMKNKCYRFTAKPGEYQSFFTSPPIEKSECDYFWAAAVPLKPKKSTRRRKPEAR